MGTLKVAPERLEFFPLKDVRHKYEHMSLSVSFLDKKLLFFTNMDRPDKAMSPKGQQEFFTG